MILKHKYAIGVHIMFYEINMVSTYIDGLLNMLSTVENKENVYLDFAFNVSQFFEKIDTAQISKKELITRFNADMSRLSGHLHQNVRIIDNDDDWYTQTSYRREFNANYCNKVDILMWGETDSCFPKETFMALESLVPSVNNLSVYRFTACFADRKMWDSSWDCTVHPNFIDHVYDDNDVDNVNQAKSSIPIKIMNAINATIDDLQITVLREPKIDGSCFVISSDLVRSGVNIPGCFIHNDDESFAFIAKKLMGTKYVQYVFKNLLKIHARRCPDKRAFVYGENNNRGFCGKEKGEWWTLFKEISQKNMHVLTSGDGKFLTYQDFKSKLNGVK